MRCKDIITTIDHYFNGEFTGLPPDVSHHMEDCDECHRYYLAAGKARSLTSMIRESEPQMNNPEALVEQIMGSLENNSGNKGLKSRSPIISKAFSRIVSAAAIILFALFSYEQYIILDKVNHLETQVKQVSTKQHWEAKAIRKYRIIKLMNAGIYQNIISQENNDHKKGINLLYLLRKEQSEHSLLTRILNNGKSVPASAFKMDTGH